MARLSRRAGSVGWPEIANFKAVYAGVLFAKFGFACKRALALRSVSSAWIAFAHLEKFGARLTSRLEQSASGTTSRATSTARAPSHVRLMSARLDGTAQIPHLAGREFAQRLLNLDLALLQVSRVSASIWAGVPPARANARPVSIRMSCRS